MLAIIPALRMVTLLLTVMAMAGYGTVGIFKTADLYVDLKGQLKILYRVCDNDRAIRRRPEQNHKAEPLYIFQEADKSDFAKRNGDYGCTWAEKVKGDKYALPSLREVFVGMKLWFVALTEAKLVGRTVNQKRRIIKRAKEDIDQRWNLKT